MPKNSLSSWIEEWLNLVGGLTISSSEVKAASELKNANLPSKIYKFRSVNEYALDNFKDDTVWLCSASRYNDPYDCASTFSSMELLNLNMSVYFDDAFIERSNVKRFLTDDDIKEVRKSPTPLDKLVELLLPHEPMIPVASREDVKNVLFKALEEVHDDYLKQHFSFWQNSTKVCSFSARLDSVVMWGHYAANQTGFCLEYDINSWPLDCIQRHVLYPVIYSEHLFDITKYLRQSILQLSSNNMLGILSGTYKALDWQYEEEWRFILPVGEDFEDQNLRVYKPSHLYMGSKISPENEAKLLNIARKRSIPVSKMRLSPRKFQLEAYQL